MKATTLQKRIETAVKSGLLSKTSKAYKVAQALAAGQNLRDGVTVSGGVIRPVFVSGSGRYVKNVDYTPDICHALDALGVKYAVGNDAPRGGACGRYINVTTKIVK